MQYKKSSNCRI